MAVVSQTILLERDGVQRSASSLHGAVHPINISCCSPRLSQLGKCKYTCSCGQNDWNTWHIGFPLFLLNWPLKSSLNEWDPSLRSINHRTEPSMADTLFPSSLQTTKTPACFSICCTDSVLHGRSIMTCAVTVRCDGGWFDEDVGLSGPSLGQ